MDMAQHAIIGGESRSSYRCFITPKCCEKLYNIVLKMLPLLLLIWLLHELHTAAAGAAARPCCRSTLPGLTRLQQQYSKHSCMQSIAAVKGKTAGCPEPPETTAGSSKAAIQSIKESAPLTFSRIRLIAAADILTARAYLRYSWLLSFST
jgi:hypothetical protein